MTELEILGIEARWVELGNNPKYRDHPQTCTCEHCDIDKLLTELKEWGEANKTLVEWIEKVIEARDRLEAELGLKPKDRADLMKLEASLACKNGACNYRCEVHDD